MPYEHQDLTRLATTPMLNAHYIASTENAKKVLGVNKENALVPIGMKHSQGGHTAARDGVALLMGNLNKVDEPQQDESGNWTIVVESGATWANIHNIVCQRGLAPFVQQSSAHFTIGGSLAVNCHGRDVRYGPISGTVTWLEVLLASGKIVRTDKGDPLFRSVIGGYGAYGLILRACLMLDRNWVMGREIQSLMSIRDYAELLRKIGAEEFQVTGVINDDGSRNFHTPHMHHGWVNVFDMDNYFQQVLPQHGFWDVYSPVAGHTEHEHGRIEQPSDLRKEQWAISEIQRAAWQASKADRSISRDFWKEISKANHSLLQNTSRLNLLREDILFTVNGADNGRADLLQEFFVPIKEFENFISSLRDEIAYDNQDIQILSCTIRFVRAPNDRRQEPILSYLRNGNSMVSIALEANVKVTDSVDGVQKPVNAVHSAFSKVIQSAVDANGSFYLPYYCFANQEQLNAAYPDLKNFLKNAADVNPKWQWDNEFLRMLREKLA